MKERKEGRGPPCKECAMVVTAPGEQKWFMGVPGLLVKSFIEKAPPSQTPPHFDDE